MMLKDFSKSLSINRRIFVPESELCNKHLVLNFQKLSVKYTDDVVCKGKIVLLLCFFSNAYTLRLPKWVKR